MTPFDSPKHSTLRSAADDSEKLGITEDTEQYMQQQHQQQQLGQLVAPISNRVDMTREYFALPVPSVPSVSLPALPSLQVTSAGVQLQTDIPTSLQITTAQPLQRQILNAFEAGLNAGMQRLSEDSFQPQLLLQSSQLGEFVIGEKLRRSDVTEKTKSK